MGMGSWRIMLSVNDVNAGAKPRFGGNVMSQHFWLVAFLEQL